VALLGSAAAALLVGPSGTQTFPVTETRADTTLTINPPAGPSTGAINTDGKSADTNGPGGSYHVVADSPTHQRVTEVSQGCTYDGTISLQQALAFTGETPSSLPRTTTKTPRSVSTGGSGGSSLDWLWSLLLGLALLMVITGLVMIGRLRSSRGPRPDHDDDPVGEDDNLEQEDTLIGNGDPPEPGTPPPITVSEKRSNNELAELAIKKECAAAMEPVELGRSLVKYTITVTNNGPTAAQNVVVADYMVQSTSPVDNMEEGFQKCYERLEVKVTKDATSDKSEGSCPITKDDRDHFVSGKCTLPLLAKGDMWTIAYEVTPTAVGNIVNGAAFRCDNLKRGWRKGF